jgi:hypothetical protein
VISELIGNIAVIFLDSIPIISYSTVPEISLFLVALPIETKLLISILFLKALMFAIILRPIPVLA